MSHALKLGQRNDAVESMIRLYMQGLPISQHVLQSHIQGCIENKDLQTARNIHSILTVSNSDSSVLGDYLIRLFGSCEKLVEADIVFCNALNPSVYTWQAIIAAYANCGEYGSALQLYNKLQTENVCLNKFTLLCILKACSKLRSMDAGRHVHNDVATLGLDTDVLIGSTLIDMYGKCGQLQEAHSIFDMLPNRNVVTWDAMIISYVNHGQPNLAIELFSEMEQENVQPNEVTYLCVLKACNSFAALDHGRLVHSQIVSRGIDADPAVGNMLIGMYAKCGTLDDAHHVFEKSSCRDVVSWSTLIAGCAVHKQGYLALHHFKQMLCEGTSINKSMLLCILKICSDMESFIEVNLMHDLLIRNDLLQEREITNTLLDAYIKCGCLYEADNVFANIRDRDIVSWGVMISGYSQYGDGSQALKFFDAMMKSNLMPNSFIFPCILKACGNLGDIIQGMQIHEDIVRNFLDSDVVVGNALVDMYARCGSMDEANKVFLNLPVRNIVSWSAMIAGYTQHEHASYAIELFKNMQTEGIEPNAITFVSALKACGGAPSISNGKLIHEKIIMMGMESDSTIMNALVDMYCKCGSLEVARELFAKLENPDDVTWSLMISGHSQTGFDEVVIELFETMLHEGQNPNKFTFPCILKACGSLRSLVYTNLVHDKIIRSGLVIDTIIGTALVDAYAKCGSLGEVRRVFNSLTTRNEIMWSGMITGYFQHEQYGVVLELFCRMLREDVNPDVGTLSCVVRSCGNIGALVQGCLLHYFIVSQESDKDNVIASSIIDMYAKCGSLEEARSVFDGFPDKDTVLWGSMIGGYAQEGLITSAVELFQKMQQVGLKPNNVIYLSILKACCSMGTTEQGKCVHNQIVETGFESDPLVGNMLIDMYSKGGDLKEAFRIFNALPHRDIVSWNMMVAGCCQDGLEHFAFELFERMQSEGLQPGKVSFLCILKACCSMGSLKSGILVHHQIVKSGLELETELGNALVNMYARCGSLEEAQNVLDRLLNLKETSWSAIIGGYAQQGNNKKADLLLSDMQNKGLKPHGMLYSNLISACSHSGQVAEGHSHFTAMQDINNIGPEREHLNCIVDLLARAGSLKQAEQLLHSLPVSPDITALMSILTSCKTYGDVEIGRRCFDQVLQFDPDTGAAYMLMSSIYANAQMWEEYQEIQKMRKEKSAWKKPGRACIEINNCANVFVVGERNHPDHVNISMYLEKLLGLMRNEGFVPSLDVSVDSDNLQCSFGTHSEKDNTLLVIHQSATCKPLIQEANSENFICV